MALNNTNMHISLQFSRSKCRSHRLSSSSQQDCFSWRFWGRIHLFLGFLAVPSFQGLPTSLGCWFHFPCSKPAMAIDSFSPGKLLSKSSPPMIKDLYDYTCPTWIIYLLSSQLISNLHSICSLDSL